MGHDSREAHIWAIIMPHVLGMDYISNTWGIIMGNAWPIITFPIKGPYIIGHEWGII